jgi:hypothetical protein
MASLWHVTYGTQYFVSHLLASKDKNLAQSECKSGKSNNNHLYINQYTYDGNGDRQDNAGSASLDLQEYCSREQTERRKKSHIRRKSNAVGKGRLVRLLLDRTSVREWLMYSNGLGPSRKARI